MTDIDKIDREILSILQWDGCMANVALAGRIGLSPAAIGEPAGAAGRLRREEEVRRDAPLPVGSPCSVRCGANVKAASFPHDAARVLGVPRWQQHAVELI